MGYGRAGYHCKYRKGKHNPRTWGRYHCTDVKNMYSFDITAAMFDRDNKDAANPGDHYANKTLFQEIKPNTVGSAVDNDEQ